MERIQLLDQLVGHRSTFESLAVRHDTINVLYLSAEYKGVITGMFEPKWHQNLQKITTK